MNSESYNTSKVIRKKFPYRMFNRDPEMTIKQLLGRDVNIISYSVNGVITDDECVIVDVVVKSLQRTNMSIEYIPVESLKNAAPDSSAYVFMFKGLPVSINIGNIKDFRKVIPVQIQVAGIKHINDKNGKPPYFAIAVRRPMHNIMIPSMDKRISTPSDASQIEIPTWLNSNESLTTSKKIQSREISQETFESYTVELRSLPITRMVDKLTKLSSAEEVKTTIEKNPTNTSVYIVDLRTLEDGMKLAEVDTINGILIAQPKREPYTIAYYHTNRYMLSVNDLLLFRTFIDVDAINYCNFIEARTLNASN